MIDLSYLESFSLSRSIQYVDFREHFFMLKEFSDAVRTRLESAYLQQLGILLITIPHGKMEEARRLLAIEGIQVIECQPPPENYVKVVNMSLGIQNYSIEMLKNSNDFFRSRLLLITNLVRDLRRKFDFYVDRAKNADDYFQYAWKIITFCGILQSVHEKLQVMSNAVLIVDEENDISGTTNFNIVTISDLIVNNLMTFEHQITLSNGKTIIPDISLEENLFHGILTLGSKKVYVEIESLVGTREPLKKIDETIKKYEPLILDHEDSLEIWIVLSPVATLLHFEDLLARKRKFENYFKKLLGVSEDDEIFKVILRFKTPMFVLTKKTRDKDILPKEFLGTDTDNTSEAFETASEKTIENMDVLRRNRLFPVKLIDLEEFKQHHESENNLL